jgi:outer membrane protein assembly factor BamB
MHSLTVARRWLTGLATVALCSTVALTGCTPVGGSPKPPDAPADDKKADAGKDESGHRGPDWPMFGGTNQRNLVNLTDKGVPTEWSVEESKEQHIKWSAKLGDKAYGGPIIADGKVFIGTNNKSPRNPRDVDKDGQPIDKGIVMCFNEADGKFLWQAVHDKLGEVGRVQDWPGEGICSSPVVEGKRLWYVSNRCEVICATTEGLGSGKNEGVTDEKYKDKTDADIVWRYDMIKELNVFPHNLAVCSPLILGDNLYVVTANGVDEGHINIPSPKAPSFICLNKKDGTLKWSSNLPSIKVVESSKKIEDLVNAGEVLMHGQWSNPVIAEIQGKPQVIFPGGNGWLYSFEPETGEVIWKFDCNPKNSTYDLGPKGTRNDFIATPVVWENKVYVGLGQDPEHKEGVSHLWCIDATKKGDVSPVNDNFDPKAPENKNSALVWHYGGPGKTSDGKRNYLFGRTISSCAVHDGLCYVGELAGYVHCLDANTGEHYWDHNAKAALWCSPYWVDGKVYIGHDRGDLLIFEHGKKLKKPIGMEVGGRVRATPVVANGVLYVLTENRLYAIK